MQRKTKKKKNQPWGLLQLYDVYNYFRAIIFQLTNTNNPILFPIFQNSHLFLFFKKKKF